MSTPKLLQWFGFREWLTRQSQTDALGIAAAVPAFETN
jgi:hypothetical protein